MIGQTISHYKILEKLGEGGMGVVYKAEDTKLKRTVALKFLPPQLTRNPQAKERFLHEAQAAAALEHPYICNVYEIDESENQIFIVMSCFDGQTLKEKIDAGPLKIDEALKIAVQAAEGLQAAHEKGIVHRDIKSANIMVTEKGQTKIMDFGLAKLKGQTRLTKAGIRLGSITYMSPEQTQAEDVDCRSDIWSLGVVLYEMITGQMPFKGEHEPAVLYSIMNEEPEPLTALRTGVPMELERIINKALSKDPSERYQHADDLVVDLRKLKNDIKPDAAISKRKRKPGFKTKVSRKSKVIGGFILVAIFMVGAFFIFKGTQKKESFLEEGTTKKKIAVLPFADMSPQKDQEYFCDGISEELINRLAKISGFQVIARTSAFSFKGKNLDIPTIGKRLKVDIVVEGSVRKLGDKLRITVQLVKVSDGCNLWSEKYNRKIKDIFIIQDEISLSIVEKLKIRLLKGEGAKLKVKYTDNIKAYNLYLRGIDYSNRGFEEEEMRIALQMFEKAVELDPNFAMAYVRLSGELLRLYWHNYDRTDMCLAKAKDVVDKVFKLSPDLPEAQQALGLYYYYAHLDYDHALEHFNKAQISLKNSPDLLLYIFAVQRRMGKFDQAVDNSRKCFELDPYNSFLVHEVGNTYLYARNYREAEYYYNQAISLSPDQPIPYGRKMLLYLLWQGSTEKMLKVLEDAPNKVRSSEEPRFILPLIKLHVINGNYQRALNQLSLLSSDTISYHHQFIPKTLLYAEVYGLMNQLELEQKHYNSARIILEKKVRGYPDDARIHSSLGIAYAGLGRKEDAIREGKLALELLPITKDFLRGPFYLKDLARIYMMVGEYDLAIDQLEFLLSIPCLTSVPLLFIDLAWDPLHNHSRFKGLLKKYSKEEK
ncbi:MAG: protein kinase [Candidatus Aminicenantes bacterium]|nr:protein kinase [Candidatus Aminicenantes bacterium]NIM82291.1 protein kinase [Candidatus Aminicenantes bacterium]NIN21674.1 protein kinase [Candidatus Aminicenantes bacterium]NIN45483.1 protein kinase [Candidatus Aminicenantes bacterium]NIN88314.1 protein kinase [Candidatus Aminicenantes bacterium]